MARGQRRVTWVISGIVVLAVVAGAAFLWVPRPIKLATERIGDPGLLERVGSPAGHRRLSVALVEVGASPSVRFAGIGAAPDTRFEAGSLTKALTGLVLADAARRREVDLRAPVSRYLDLGDSAAGQVSLAELATHHAGYPRLGSRTWWQGLITAYTADNPYRADRAQLLDEARSATITGRGTYAYSNLGAAIAGQAVASAAGSSYRDVMKTRLFTPLGMRATEVADRPIVHQGLTTRGRPSAPWVADGYAPAGGVVTTGADLAILATEVLRGTAPGVDALTPRADAGGADRKVGLFWQYSAKAGDRDVPVTWHNGATGGYTAFLGFDRARKRAVIVLSDTATSVDDLGIRLLTT